MLKGKPFQIVAALVGSLCAFSAGTAMAWTSQISQELLDGDMGFPIDKDQLGWVGSLMPLGAAAFTLFTGPICDRIGRKRTMLLLVVPKTMGWFLIIWAQTITMLYVGRFLTGMVSGAFIALSAIYVNELAQDGLRGTLGSFTQLMINAGCTYPTIIGLFLNLHHYNIFCAVVPLISGTLLLFMPETPVHLLRKRKIKEARLVLESMRSTTHNVEDELMEIKDEMDKHVKSAFNISSFKRSDVQRACVVCFGIMVLKKTCGADAFTDYTSYIFQIARLRLDPKIQTVIVNVIITITSVFQTYIIERASRKLLLCLSAFIMTISLVVVGTVFMVKNREIISPDLYVYVDYLPLAAIIVYSIAYPLGLSTVPWILLEELFPQELRSTAVSIATTIFWVGSFAVTKLFMVVDSSLGADVAFFMFGASTFLTFIFALVLVKETKGT